MMNTAGKVDTFSVLIQDFATAQPWTTFADDYRIAHDEHRALEKEW